MALPWVDFALAPDRTTEVCRVTAFPPPLPVYLKPVEGCDGAVLWVWVGNSTRYLEVDGAVDYVILQWPRINHMAQPIRLGNFPLRRSQSRRTLSINPATVVTAITGSRDDEDAGQQDVTDHGVPEHNGARGLRTSEGVRQGKARR